MTDPSPDCGYTEEELAQMDAVDANPGPNCVTPWEPTPLTVLDAEGRPQRPLTRVGSYKLMEIRPFHTRTWREAIVIAWGTDIFVGRIPLLKLAIALTLAFNVLFWWLLS